ncbi:MAG: hypothetical protein ACR2PM_09735 [Hyphomicrobiales bacterium]
MKIEDTGNLELDQLRQILLTPMEKTNELRDQKILDFIKGETASTLARLNQIEARLVEISDTVADERRRTVTDIGDAIAELGQQLKRLGGEPDMDDEPEKVQSIGAGGNLRQSVIRALK